MSTDEYENWYEVLESGKDDAVLALLVTLLPNLQRLDIEFEPKASSTKISLVPLSRFREVTVETTDEFIRVQFLWPFFISFIVENCGSHQC